MKKPLIIPTRIWASRYNLTVTAAHKRIQRAYRKWGGLLPIESDLWVVRKPGRDYMLTLVEISENPVNLESSIKEEIGGILRQQAQLVCRECKASVINPMIDNCK